MNGSSSNGNLEMEANSSLQSELEALLLEQQQSHDLILERERILDINRCGSAPPTIEDALCAAGSVFNYDSGRNNTANIGALTEEEIRSHPAYFEYYYSNHNLNPRLPLPLLSKEDWRVTQRVRAAGFDLGRNNVENGGASSLFAMQPSISVNRSEDEMVELRKGSLVNFSRKYSAEMLEKGSTGFLGGPSTDMGIRRKSFADILQEGIRQPYSSTSGSRNSPGNVITSIGISSNHDGKLQEKSKYMLPAETINSLNTTQNIESPNSSIFTSCVSSSSMNLRNELNGRSPSFVNLSKEVHHSEMGAYNSASSSIFEVGASLSELDISTGRISRPFSIPTRSIQNLQENCFHGSGAVTMIDNRNYANLGKANETQRLLDVSKSVTNDRVGFPRRTYSTSELQSTHYNSEFSGLEDLKPRFRSSNRPAPVIHNDLNSGSFLNNGGMIHVPATTLHQMQYTQQGLNRERDSNKLFSHLQAVEKAYLETMLIKQMHQCHSHLLQKNCSFNNQYHGNPVFVPSNASYQGSFMPNFQVASRIHMLQNEKPADFLPNLRSMKGESTCSSDSKGGSNVKGRFESLLQLLKNDKTSTLELSDIHGHVVEFSLDQVGSRFLQQKLETATTDEKAKILAEIIPHAHGLTIDVFGNYVIQKFFEHGTESQRNELAKHLVGHVLCLSLHTYGCRVIQKVLEVVDAELQAVIVRELDGSVMKCVHDQNGNHVIQKCIERVPQDHIRFMISSFLGQVVNFSTHPYGCRVIQRILEHFDDRKIQEMIMDEIISSVCKLAQDQYGNYVIQHIVLYGRPEQRPAIIHKLAGQIVKMSQQKFASNVVEKCLSFASSEERRVLVNEMLGTTDENEPLQAMMKDPFGNYVVQKVLETCDDKSRELIVSRIRVHLNVLKRYTYGKHIVSRVEKLVPEGGEHQSFS